MFWGSRLEGARNGHTLELQIAENEVLFTCLGSEVNSICRPGWSPGDIQAKFRNGVKKNRGLERDAALFLEMRAQELPWALVT